MNLISKIVKKVDRAIQYLENPDLWYLRQNEGISDLYEKVSQPWLKNIGIKTILDIGANVGQSTVTLARVFPDAKIYAFEPIPECYEKLASKFVDCDNVSTINIAFGSEPGELSLELSDYTPSSSFRKMHSRHVEAFPNTVVNQTVSLRVDTLDTIGTSLNGLMNVPYALQLAYGWTKLALYINIVAIALLIPLLFWLTGKYGSIGAASVWAILNGGYVLIEIRFMHLRLLKGELRRWYYADIVKPLIGALIGPLIVTAYLMYQHSRSSLDLWFVFGAFLLSFLGSLIFTDFTNEKIKKKLINYIV